MSPIEDLNVSLHAHPELTLDLWKGFSHSLCLLVHANKHTKYSISDLDTSNVASNGLNRWHIMSDLLSIKDSSNTKIPVCLGTEADGLATLDIVFNVFLPHEPFQKHLIGYLSQGTLAVLRQHLMADRVYTVQLAKPKVPLRCRQGEERELRTQDVPCDTRPIEFTVVAGTPIPRFEYTMAFSQEALHVFHPEKCSLNLTVTCLSPRPVVVLFQTRATRLRATRRTAFTPTPRRVEINSVSTLANDLTDPSIPSINYLVDLYALQVHNSSGSGFTEIQHDSAGAEGEWEVLFTSGGRLTLTFRISEGFRQTVKLGHAYWFSLDDRVYDVGFSHWRYANDDEICGLSQGLVMFKELQHLVHNPLLAWDGYSATEAIKLQDDLMDYLADYLADFQRNGPIVFEPVRKWEKTVTCMEKVKPWPLFKLPRELRDLVYWFVKHSEWAKGCSFRVHAGEEWEAPAVQKAEEMENLERIVYKKH
ncbi:MAG: hypothetical protein LQ342_001897 [Letrouitia transgressa]|nr:MAG: hypothetical protein LQ342_001897 [Letrouitia transgressa]